MKPYTGGIRHDYKEGSSNVLAPRRGRRWSWFALGLALPLATVSLLVSESNQSKQSASDNLASHVSTQQVPLAISASQPHGAGPAPIGPDPQRATASDLHDGMIVDLLVRRGDTLEILFRRNGLRLADLAEMVQLPDAAEHLGLLRPGNEIRVTHRDGTVLSLVREIDEIELLEIRRNESGFEALTIARDVDTRTVDAHGVIGSSLFEAAAAAGVSDRVTMEMAGIFQWDIDFIQDVRSGDEFTVIYEELWRDGVKLRNGDILAAEFVNRGASYRAARYSDAAGHNDFYTPEGLSVRKAFIRAPVDFTRISSNFNPNRRHPVLNTIRAHRGVDYAAPTGTAVKAAGDGTVEFRGANGGYGNVVNLRHGGNITTLYGHLSRYGKPRVGNHVKQGDIIGYVGRTGLATGPHLHYEYRIGGVHRNPRTVSLSPADPIPAKYRQDFEVTTATLWRQLDLYPRTRVADAAD